MGLDITPDGTWLYIVNNDSNTVSAVHTGDAREVMQIPVGAEPLGIAIDHAGRYAYVTNSTEDPEEMNGTVSVIDIASRMVVGEIPVGKFPGWGIAVSNDDKKLAVANTNDDTVYLIDTATRSLISVISRVDGDIPMGVAFGPGDTWLYIAYFSDGTTDHVKAVDLTGRSADRYYDADGNGPFGVYFHPGGAWFAVSNYFGHDVYHCAIVTGATGATDTAAGPMRGAFTADGNGFLMPCFASSQGVFRGTVEVFDCSAGTPVWVRGVNVGINPAAVAVANAALGISRVENVMPGIDLFAEPKVARAGESVYLHYSVTLPRGMSSVDAGVTLGAIVNDTRTYAFKDGFNGVADVTKASSMPKTIRSVRLTNGQSGYLRFNGLPSGVTVKFFLALTDLKKGTVIYRTFANSVIVE